MAPARTQPQGVTELASFLREADRRSRGLDRAQRRRVVEICLAYRLLGVPADARRRMLESLRQEFGGRLPAPARSSTEGREARLPTQTQRALLALSHAVLGPAAEHSGGPDSAAVLDAAESIRAAVGRLGAMGAAKRASCLMEVLDRIDGAPLDVEGPLEQAAQEFLDRLLDAFDPEAAKAHVAKKGLKLTSFYKASVYDALCEKFEQLKQYHERGRLVRDLRAAFRRNLRQSKT